MDPIAAPSHVSRINLIFFLGCFMFDCMACTWDDVLDQDIDRKQARTKFRPLARRAVSTTNAVLYTGFQLVLGAALLTQFPPQCLYYAIPSVFLIGLYPLSKRVINYPQVFLGVTWAYGGVMGFAAMGVDLFNSPAAMKTSLCLYFSGKQRARCCRMQTALTTDRYLLDRHLRHRLRPPRPRRRSSRWRQVHGGHF